MGTIGGRRHSAIKSACDISLRGAVIMKVYFLLENDVSGRWLDNSRHLFGSYTYPANHSFRPPASMPHDAHRVFDRSNTPRLLVCCEGKQLMRAVMLDWFELWPSPAPASVTDSCEGERTMSRSSHQSSSVILSIPMLLNHALLPRGAKK